MRRGTGKEESKSAFEGYTLFTGFCILKGVRDTLLTPFRLGGLGCKIFALLSLQSQMLWSIFLRPHLNQPEARKSEWA